MGKFLARLILAGITHVRLFLPKEEFAEPVEINLKDARDVKAESLTYKVIPSMPRDVGYDKDGFRRSGACKTKSVGVAQNFLWLRRYWVREKGKELTRFDDEHPPFFKVVLFASTSIRCCLHFGFHWKPKVKAVFRSSLGPLRRFLVQIGGGGNIEPPSKILGDGCGAEGFAETGDASLPPRIGVPLVAVSTYT